MPALHITQALDLDPQACTWDHHQTQTPGQAHVVFLQSENRRKCYSPFELPPGPFQALSPIPLGLTPSGCCCLPRSLHWPSWRSLCAISSLSTQNLPVTPRRSEASRRPLPRPCGPTGGTCSLTSCPSSLLSGRSDLLAPPARHTPPPHHSRLPPGLCTGHCFCLKCSSLK